MSGFFLKWKVENRKAKIKNIKKCKVENRKAKIKYINSEEDWKGKN